MIQIKVKNHKANLNIIQHSNMQKSIVQALFWTLGLFALIYVLLLANMIFNIVERKSLENYARNLSAEVSNLELDYLSMADKIDLAYANSLGFKEVNIKFASRKPLSLSMVQNEI